MISFFFQVAWATGCKIIDLIYTVSSIMSDMYLVLYKWELLLLILLLHSSSLKTLIFFIFPSAGLAQSKGPNQFGLETRSP